MDRHAEPERDEIEQDRERSRRDVQTRERKDDHRRADERVDHAIEPELFRGDRKLAVHRQDEERIELPGTHQLRNVRDVDEEKRLEKLPDNLVRADEQHHLPLRPIANLIDLTKDDAEKKNLA